MINYQVKRKFLSEQVIAQIKNYIINQELKPGDRLPTEADMAERFEVSRSSIREATKALNFLGIIESAPRRGLTVGHVDIHRIAEFMGFHFALSGYSRESLLQARIVIEVGALPYAINVIQTDEKFYNQLLSLTQKLESETDPDKYIKDDLEFHNLLVKASGIEPLIAFNDLLQVFFERFRSSIINAHPDSEIGAGHHKDIIKSLKNGDLLEAEKQLRQHLEYHKIV